MSEYLVSKFVPLPDVAPLPEACPTTPQNANFHLLCHNICSPDSVQCCDNNLDCKFSEEALNLFANGDVSFRKGYFREAVVHYTELLKKFSSDTNLQATALLKRSGTFAMIACELRVRPVGACALYGMDAGGIAQLAFKDAERGIRLHPQCSEGYLKNAFALYLMEKYQKAMDTCLEGLQWNFEDSRLKKCLCLVQTQLSDSISSERSIYKNDGSKQNQLQEQITKEDFECMLCLKLLYKPVTTPCGHSFCMSCLQRSLDHSNKCPFCRTVIHVGHTLPVSVTLNDVVSQLFSDETELRKLEMGSISEDGIEKDVSSLPLFVLFALFPGEKVSLNVFEPRYRLMIRRVMEGNRRFGMIQSCQQAPHGICEIGTECEIIECESLPDGRYFLEVIGRRRFEVLQHEDQDGYRVVKAKYFHDYPSDPESSEYKVMEQHLKTIEKLEHSFKVRGLYHRQSGLTWDLSGKPENDMEKKSFTACALLVNHDGSSTRRQYLEVRSTYQRMEWITQRMGYYP